MEDTYKTIATQGEGVYKEKGSKFISFAYHITSEEEVKPILNELREKYYDARHYCYAWRLGYDGARHRAVDDGEPSSTAGKPILGQILSKDLTNVLVVVIRYFGGTKLGVSGLIVAYREAAFEAIVSADIVERTVDEIVTISFSYMVMNDVMKVIKEESPEVLLRDFEMECRMKLLVRLSKANELRQKLEKIESLVLE